ncbi:MAG: hypothetical protein ACE5LX_02160 [Nitrospinota bacterium]
MRLQGTDGVRGLALPGDHPSLAGLSPLDAFIEKGLVTEGFIRLYARSCAEFLQEELLREAPSLGKELVVGWDPRDGEGNLAEAALEGVRASGLRAVRIGVLPTPAIALYMLFRGAAGALALTASHNPSDQNGLKLFLGGRGLKPLPRDDERLTERVFSLARSAITTGKPLGEFEDGTSEARSFFISHLLRPENSWARGEEPLRHYHVIVDPVGGALSGLAAEALSALGARDVLEVNPAGESPVNEGGGVVSLEGVSSIAGDLRGQGGADLAGHGAVAALFRRGKALRGEARVGGLHVVGAVFDADGDRAALIWYDPLKDRALVLSGDEMAFLQASFLLKGGAAQESSLFVHTIESDLNLSLALRSLAIEPKLSAVGDKWLLSAASSAGLGGEAPGDSLSLTKALLSGGHPAEEPSHFALGWEESGHLVSRHSVAVKGGGALSCPLGCGLKAVINTLVSVEELGRGMAPENLLELLAAPFQRGIKGTLYAYYTDRELFFRGSLFWEDISQFILGEARKLLGSGFRAEPVDIPGDPDVLYFSLNGPGGEERCALFVRNSGTESKTGVSFRGRGEGDEPLLRLAGAVHEHLLFNLKSLADPYARAELKALSLLKGHPQPASALQGKLSRLSDEEGISLGRLVKEMKRQGLVKEEGQILSLTSLGEAFLKTKRRHL